jgi:hypothetical protein
MSGYVDTRQRAPSSRTSIRRVPPRKKTAAAPPLTDADVKDLAFRVKGGDSPRVIVRSASAAVPAGTRGNVIRIGNPSEGEYIVVRLGRDQVPFAPNELSLSTRGRTASSTTTAATAKPAAAPAKKTAAASSRPSRASVRSTAKAATKTTKSSPARSVKTTPAKSAPRAAAKETAKAAPSRTTPTAARRTTSRSSSRRGKGRSPQPLTVTMRFADSRWTIEAQRGSRRLAKAQPLRPGAVSAFAEHVDEEAVRDALVETVESCRAVVEEKAAVLRAELESAEAALREYDAKRR